MGGFLTRRVRQSAWVAIILGVAVVMTGVLFIERIPPDHLGAPLRSGAPAGPLVAPGIHMTHPLTRWVLLPSGRHARSGAVRAQTPEGSTVSISFQAEFDFSGAEWRSLGPLVLRLDRGVLLDDAIGEAASELLSDAAATPAALEGVLRPMGAVEGTLRAGKERVMTGPPNPLRDAWAGPPFPVVIIGVDSADWDLIDPLIEMGDLPRLAALKKAGAWGVLHSMTPTLSPILWTTIATGRAPEDHGIIDFLMKDPATGLEVPISRLFRRVKALWNIATDVGLSSMTIGWWATWPAEPVDGFMVTDRVAFTLFDLPLDRNQPGLAHPPSLLAELEDLRVDVDAISYEDVRAVAGISRRRFEKARTALEGSRSYDDPVAHLIKILASTLTYHRTAVRLLKTHAPGLSLVYYEGLDEVNHRFAHFLPPAMRLVAGADPEDAKAFAQAIPNFYRLQDRLIGELIDAADPNAVILVLSDHGFANGAERPVDVPPDVEGRPGLWHSMDGIVVAAGPPIRQGRIDGMELLDVTPTVLALLGLPQADDMPGRVIEAALTREALPAPPPTGVASYDDLGTPLQAPGSGASPADDEVIARLRALGYVDSGGSEEGTGTATYHVNAGHIFLRKRELDRAQSEFERARDIAPRFDQAHLGLAQVSVERGRPQDALPHLKAALSVADPQPILLTRTARVFARAGRADEGIAFLSSLDLEGRADAFRRAAVGMLRETQGDARGAAEDYSAALASDRSVVEALRGLYGLLREQGDLEALARTLQASLDVEQVSVAVRAANWLALTRERQGRAAEARAILTDAFGKLPDDVMTLTNLGSMLVREDRAQEGLPYLERAHQQQPAGHEVQVNMIVAHGKLGHLEKSLALFREARASARPEEMTSLLNAIGYVSYLNAAPAEAEKYLVESLRLQPDQPEALGLLEAVRAPAAR